MRNSTSGIIAPSVQYTSQLLLSLLVVTFHYSSSATSVTTGYCVSKLNGQLPDTLMTILFKFIFFGRNGSKCVVLRGFLGFAGFTFCSSSDSEHCDSVGEVYPSMFGYKIKRNKQSCSRGYQTGPTIIPKIVNEWSTISSLLFKVSKKKKLMSCNCANSQFAHAATTTNVL